MKKNIHYSEKNYLNSKNNKLSISGEFIRRYQFEQCKEIECVFKMIKSIHLMICTYSIYHEYS